MNYVKKYKETTYEYSKGNVIWQEWCTPTVQQKYVPTLQQAYQLQGDYSISLAPGRCGDDYFR